MYSTKLKPVLYKVTCKGKPIDFLNYCDKVNNKCNEAHLLSYV